MYFRYQQQSQIITVEADYARLANVRDNGDLDFVFTYSLSQQDAITYNTQKLTINVETKNIAAKPLLGNTIKGKIDVRGLVNNIRTAMIDAKSTLQQQQRYIIATRDSDITAKINNNILPQLRAKAPFSTIQTLNRPRLKLVSANSVKQANDPQPVLQMVANSVAVPDVSTVLTGSLGEVPQALMHDMITRQGLDPSYVLSLTPRSRSEDQTHGGLSNPQQALEYTTDPASRLLNFYLFPPSSDLPPTTTDELADSEQVQVLQTVTDDTVTINVPVTIPAAKLFVNGTNVTQVFVTFNLINSNTNLPIDVVTQTLDLSKQLHVYYTPRIAPTVKAAASDISTRVNLEIKQVDPGATEIQVYKKNFWISSTETDDYSLIGQYSLTSRDQSLLVQVDQPTKSPVLYRVVAVGQQSVQGFDFTNVAVKPSRYTPVRAVALTALQVDTGIQLEVRHIPTNCVAIQFLRWNMTTFDADPTIALDDVGFIDDATRLADILSAVDTDVSPNNIYRYVARIMYQDGATTDYGDATLEFIQPSPGEVDTQIANIVVSHDTSPNVTFDITTSTTQTDMDAIKQMLDNQGLTDYFTGDVAAQRDQLQSLIAHSVYRVDLNTGDRVSYGILTVSSFDDNALGKKQAVTPLVYGHRYRYEIYPLLRTPETLLDSYVKQAVDATTKKPYSFSPAKFLHPYTLTQGVIVTTNGVRLRTAKDPMAYGVVGAIASTEVSFDDDTAGIVDLVASVFDRETVVVTWGILGDLSQVDHFIVMKQVHNIRTIVGKVHSEFANGSCQYVHTVTNHDVGSLSYVIVPIYNDYRVGTPATTNTLVIEAL